MRADRTGEEPTRRQEIALRRHPHVDDLAGLIHGPVHVTPPAGDPNVGLVDEPTIADPVPARPSCVGQEWRESLNPPIDRDVVDLDPTLTEEFLDIAIREPVPQIPTD